MYDKKQAALAARRERERPAKEKAAIQKREAKKRTKTQRKKKRQQRKRQRQCFLAPPFGHLYGKEKTENRIATKICEVCGKVHRKYSGPDLEAPAGY